MKLLVVILILHGGLGGISQTMTTTESGVGMARNVLRTVQGLEMEIPNLPGERIAVTFFRPDIVRLRISQRGKFEEEPSHALEAEPGQMEAVGIRIQEFEGRVQVGTHAMEVSLFLDPFHVPIS